MTITIVQARSIRSYEEIDQLQELNGVPIAEIERRARPGVYARSGFLGAHESLKDVLKQDWRAVERLGTTHVDLANQIDAISREVPYAGSRIIVHTSTSPKPLLKRAPFKLAVLIFVVSAVVAIVFSNPLGWFGLAPAVRLTLLALSKKEILWVIDTQTRGMQDDIFGGSGWNSDITIVNLSNLEGITIGAGVVDYIRNYGFYEGGAGRNPYRVDPDRLSAII